MSNNLAAFLITLGAGLATAIGGSAVRFGSLQSPQFLSLSMAFSAGLMLHVSYVEILTKSIEAFTEAWPVTETDSSGPKQAVLISNAMLFTGALGVFLLGRAVAYFQHLALSEDENERLSMMDPQVSDNDNTTGSVFLSTEDLRSGNQGLSVKGKYRMMRISIVTTLAITAHNLPEGLASFIALSSGIGNGLPLAVAIMIHNIPEGVCVAVPILYATGSRWRAFLIALVAGLAEPVGAGIGWLILGSINPESINVLYGYLFGLVAGLMIYIALVELIPAAVTYYPSHPGRVSMAMLSGVFIMALSLVIFEFA